MKNKILQIDIIGDATKFLKSLSDIQKEAKATKTIVEGVGNSVDTSGIDRVGSKLGELGGKAKQAGDEVEGKFKPVLEVDTSNVTKKLQELEGDAKSTKATIEKKTELQLSIEQGKEQLDKLKQDYKAAKDNMEAKVQIQLDISDVTNKISDAKKKIKELDDVTPKISLEDKIAAGVDKGNKKTIGTGIKAAVAIEAGQALVGGAISMEEFQKTLMQNGMDRQGASQEASFAFKSAARGGVSTDEYITLMAPFFKATGIDPSRLDSQEKGSIVSQLSSLEKLGYGSNEVMGGVMALAKQKNVTPQEALLETYGLTQSKGFTDTKSDLFDNIAEYTQTFGKTKTRGEIYNMALRTSQLGLYATDKTYDVNKEMTPMFLSMISDTQGGQLKELNRITGKDFGDLVKGYKGGKLNMEDFQGQFIDRIGKLSTSQVLDLVQSGFKMPMGEDVGGENFMKIIQAGHLTPEQSSQLEIQLLSQGQKSTQDLKSMGTFGKMVTFTGGAFSSLGSKVANSFKDENGTDVMGRDSGTEDFTKNIKYLDLSNPNGNLQDQVANINKIGTTVNSNSTVINNYYGQESIDSQSQKENIKSGQTGYEWLKSRGKIK